MALLSDKILQRPLYIFDLPTELLYSLQLKTQPTAEPESSSNQPLSQDTPTTESTSEQAENSKTAATSCALCGLSFVDLLEQRSHVRSDLHGYNIKQKLRGKKPVTENEFERLVGQLDESISGSDTSDSEEEDEAAKSKDSTLTALLRRQAKITNADAEDAPTSKRTRGAGNAPMVWFTSPKLPSNTSLGVYRSIFSTIEQEEKDHLVETIQKKQLVAKAPQAIQKQKQVDNEDGGVPLPKPTVPSYSSTAGPHYFLCMIGGGHFAGMLVSLTPKLTKKSGIEDRSASVIAHKTFHRYTTRRKQGGSQSSNDNSKGNAHSAGAGIRRYNEAALEQEVRDLLTEWKPWIDTAELIFVRATGTTNRRTLFGPYDGQVLSQKDDRLRGFPFNTRRATQSELMRAFVELTRVKVNVVDEAALARQAEEAAAAKAKAEAAANGKSASTPKPAKATKEDEEAALHTTQLQGLIRRSKAPGMLSYLQSNKLSADFRFFPAEQNHHAPTPLHLAAASNSAPCVNALLVKARADATVKNADGKSPFEIAGDRATRDAFRLARSNLGEAYCDWDAAGVPAALSQQEVDARAARDKESQAADEAAEKQRRAAEMERIRKEDAEKQTQAQEKKFGKAHTILDKGKMTAQETRMEQARGMTDEMRMRLEREKRARAAEERMKRLQGK